MKLISIGQLDKNIFYPILGGIFNFIIKLILNYNGLTSLFNHSLMFCINTSLGMSLSFILLIVYRKKPKPVELPIPKNKGHSIELEYTNQYEEIRYHKFFYIILSSIIDFIITIITFHFYLKAKLNMWMLDILFIYLFSYLIFKMKLYKHHYISGSIIFIFGIILNIIDKRYRNIDDFTPLIKLCCEFLLSFALVVIKYTMEKKYCSSFELCFYQGLITFILYTIVYILEQYFNFIGDNFMGYYDDFKNSITKETIMFLLIMLIQFFKNLFIFATVEKTTPFHYLIILVIGEFSSSIIDNINIITVILKIICFCIIFFMILVFNEIIELNCFGLNTNTKKGISNRADMDNINKEMRNESIISEDGKDIKEIPNIEEDND